MNKDLFPSLGKTIETNHFIILKGDDIVGRGIFGDIELIFQEKNSILEDIHLKSRNIWLISWIQDNKSFSIEIVPNPIPKSALISWAQLGLSVSYKEKVNP